MGKLIRAGGAILAAGLLVVFAWGARAQTAASDVGVGGYHELAVEAAQRDLLAGAPEAPDTGFRIAIEFGADLGAYGVHAALWPGCRGIGPR